MSQFPEFKETSLRSWLPSTSLTALRQEMGDLMENFFGDSAAYLRADALPRVDISESADAIEITTDLPGFNAEDVHVEVGEKTVMISGKHSQETEKVDEKLKFHRIERRTGDFSRTVWLPCPVNEEKIDAQLTNGVLKIHLPKREESRRRTVEVKTGEVKTGAQQTPPSSSSS